MAEQFEGRAFQHQPVLLEQVIAGLNPQPGGLYLDGTLGGGGHAAALLAAADCRLIGIDRDAEALAAAALRLAPYQGRFTLVQANYSQMAQVMQDLDAAAGNQLPTRLDGVLLDIGVSSYQLDQATRGFSYLQDAPLDMRMDQSQGQSAADLLREISEDDLTDILYRYGEEKWARRIAKFIVAARAEAPLMRTGQLVEIIKKAVPKGARDKDQHPAKRSFQAIRIAVNGELAALEQGLQAAIGCLRPGGVLAVITFHSLEDRIVKERLRLAASDCICPPELPVCTCNHRAEVALLHRKPQLATAEELAANPRARSAKLRLARKLGV